LLLVACGNPSREDLLTPHESPGGEYRVFFLEPPWQVMENDGAFLRLEIEANATRFGDLDAGTVPPKYLCEVDVTGGSAARRIRDAERDARSAGDEIVRAATDVATRSGASGQDLVISRTTSDGTRFARVVYLDREDGGVVSVYFEANHDLRNAELDAMIGDVVVDPE
jgi:hypothetical protein